MDYADIESFINKNKPDIAILTVSQKSVKEVAQHLVDLGIKGLWNFSYTELDSDTAVIENVHLSDSLMMLSYKLKQRQNKDKGEI